MRFCVFDQARAAGKVPFSPWRDDLYVRVEAVIPKLKTDLIIAFASGTMRDRVGPCLGGDFDLAFGDQRSRDGRA